MPPQVSRTGSGTATQQPTISEEQKDAKSTSSSTTTNAAGVKTEIEHAKTDQSTDVKKDHHDSKAAAKAAQGSKQHATEKKNERNLSAQVVKDNLQNRVGGEGGWESIKTAGRIVANLPGIAGEAAGALAESGAAEVFKEKKQQVEELSRRPYPQDRIPGKMYETEDISRGSENTVKTEPNTEQRATMNESRIGGVTVPGFPGIEFVDHPKEARWTNQQGVEQRLKDLNGGSPLTDFEKKVVSEWNHDSGGKTLTPIKGTDDNEVQGYKLTTGGSGNRKTTYYDRDGNVLRGTRYSEVPLIDRGLGPIEYAGVAQLGKQVVTKAAGKIFVSKEAETVVKAEIGAATRTGAKAEADAAVKAESSAGRTVAPPSTRGVPQTDPTSPTVIGGGKVSIRTSRGNEEIPFGEYERRVNEAKKWVEQESAGVPRGHGLWKRKEQLYEQAQDRFGLQPNWQAYQNNPNLVGARVRDAARLEAEAAKKAPSTNANPQPEPKTPNKPEGARTADPAASPAAPQIDPGTPNILGGGRIGIRTSEGTREITIAEYRRRWTEAKQWVDRESANIGRSRGKWKAKEELYELAQTRYGLQKNWQAYQNEPNLVAKRLRDVDHPGAN